MNNAVKPNKKMQNAKCKRTPSFNNCLENEIYYTTPIQILRNFQQVESAKYQSEETFS